MFTSSMDAITYTPSNESYILMTSKYMKFFREILVANHKPIAPLSNRTKPIVSLNLIVSSLTC